MWKKFALSASLAALITGCGGAEDDQSQPHNTGEAHTEQSTPSGPFAEIEMQMHSRMMAAIGANASETWARKMIEHHRGALAMSQLLIEQGREPAMVQMARQTVGKQRGEIAELDRMLQGGIGGGAGNPNPFGPIEQEMRQAMMTAGGANLSEEWARKMIIHHQGAVDMSELLLRDGDGDKEVLAMARRIADEQTWDIAHLEAMLRGEAMPVAAPAGASGSAAPAGQQAPKAGASANREQDAASKTKSAPKPPARKQAAPSPAPEASPAPKETCTPEHAAMGHC